MGISAGAWVERTHPHDLEIWVLIILFKNPQPGSRFAEARKVFVVGLEFGAFGFRVQS